LYALGAGSVSLGRSAIVELGGTRGIATARPAATKKP